SNSPSVSNATALGIGAQVGCNHCMVLGDATDALLVTGIGTIFPHGRLHVVGGPAWTSNGWTGSVALDNGSAIGWRGVFPNFGIGRTNGGLYFFHSFSTLDQFGDTTFPAMYDMVITDDGTVGINTSTPNSSYKLHVAAGNTLLDGFV